MIILENQPLKTLNTFRISAKAKKYLSIQKKEDLGTWHKNYRPHEPLLILGGGSNILLTDDFPGTVLHIQTKGISIVEENKKNALVQVAAGENWHDFTQWSIHKNLGGLENLSLIPGYVGAAPMQNIGAYGVEVKDTITRVKAFYLKDGTEKWISKQDCHFDYRSSIFKTQLKNKVIITEVEFKLNQVAHHALNISYGAIQSELKILFPDCQEDNYHIQQVSDAVMAIRSAKLPDPKVVGNGGSFFKNPIISKKTFKEIQQKFPDVVAYPAGENMKLAAGWLIEKAGWKQKEIHGVRVHPKQALVIINPNEKSGKDVYHFSAEIIKDIFNIFGVELEREINVI